MKKEIFIRELGIDFNADRNENEKRLTIGEHNGEEWIRNPKSIILNQSNKSAPIGQSESERQKSDNLIGQFSSIFLNSNAEISLSCYLKLKIEIEEIHWNGSNALKTLIFRFVTWLTAVVPKIGF